MLLQSPVWIALYATLFYAYDLRHEPAFYGVFQHLTGGSWMFLADLSRADHAIPLPAFHALLVPALGDRAARSTCSRSFWASCSSSTRSS